LRTAVLDSLEVSFRTRILVLQLVHRYKYQPDLTKQTMQKASATRVLFYQFFALSTSDETYEQMFTDKSGIEGSQPHDCTNELLKSD